MFDSFRDLNDRINRDALRVERPNHVIFLCGGVMAEDEESKASPSLRDYLIRTRKIQRLLNGQIVLAETAQQLYRDTNYPDLISFEEDIARVASIVLVITESAGSLAELGAFASEPVLRDALRVIISEKHFAENSFVRWGPVKRVEARDRTHIGTFPWRTHDKNGNIVKSSIKDYVNDIAAFINEKVGQIDDSKAYHLIPDRQIFFDIIWILHLLEACPPGPLYEAVRIIHPNAGDDLIRDKIFTLKICRLVESFSYSNRDFFFLPMSIDPYDYAYNQGQRVRDLDAKKLEISTEFRDSVDLTRNILRRLAEKREELS